MAGVNCKRHLQNKSGDRKRKQPNAALLESTDTVDVQAVGDTPNRLRQTTRHSIQRHLTSVINNASKINKTDVTTRNSTTVSKKILRSTKQDSKQLNYNRMSFTNSNKPDVDNSKSTASLENDNKYDFQREDGYKKLEDENIQEKNMVETLDDEADRNDEENHEEESKHIYKKTKTMAESAYQSSSYICYSSNNIALRNLKELNENTSVSSSSYNKSKEECEYEELDDVVFQNNDRNPLVEGADKIEENKEQNKKDKSYKNRNENNKVVIENIERLDNISKINQAVSTHTTLHELHEYHMDKQNMNVSTSRTHFNENRNEQQLVHTYELSHLSNSLCSENISISDPSCKKSIKHINNNCKSKETKQLLDNDIPIEKEENKKHLCESTNVTIKTSLQKSTNQPQNTLNVDISKSTREDKYHHYNANEYNDCTIKSSPSTLSPVNITLRNKQEICNETTVNSTFENVCYEQTVNKRDCPDVQRSIAAVSNTDFKREEQALPFNNLKTSVNNSIDNVIDNDCNINTLKLNITTLDQPKHLLLEEKDEEDPHEKLQLQLNNRVPQGTEHFEKCLKKSSLAQRDALTTQQNDRITHQQHEKEIIDAADKVYTQIEEQYHQHHVTSISSTYNDLINNHSANRHEREEQHQRHNVSSLSQLQTLQHTMQQHHYSSEPLYQLQQQLEHHQQNQMHRHQIQKQEELQKQHNIPPNSQREHRHNLHLMDFLHPQHHHSNISNTHSPLHQQQQQHQINEVYHDLMMDEVHENHNTPYKLGLSPSANKHENQDDGYETSAGDVLTPNSHASSTNSMTPQHNMQHGGLVTNIVKCNEQHQQNSIRLQKPQHHTHIINDQNRNIQQELVKKDSTTNLTSGDTFHFMGDDITLGTNNSLRHILTPPHSQTRSNQEGGTINGYMTMQSEASAPTPMSSSSDIYTLTKSSLHHHHSEKSCLDTNSIMPISNADHQHFTEVSTKCVNEEQNSILNLQTKTIQKRRGRKKKIPGGSLPQTLESSNPNDVNSVTGFCKTKERKKHDRFNGMSEEEVGKRILPDHLCDNLDIVIIGINPGLFAAYKGHHYAGPGNHFWKCLYLSGLTQEQMNADDDSKLIKYGIGFTNMVQRATKGSADLTRKEIKEGSRILLDKLQRFRPKVAVFNGKLIFEVFSGKKDFNFGRQPECVEGTDTFIWVMPSSSARCAQLPRAADKVPFYAALKKFRDYLNGLIPHIDQSECVFTEERIKQQCDQENYKNQENNVSGVNNSSYQNAVGISNTINSLQNQGGYPFDSEGNPHSTRERPRSPSTTDINVNNSFMMSSLVGAQHEKKKRGRPKKVKGQAIIDPVTGNKIQVNSQSMGANGGEYANILNLSTVHVSNSEMPKKKRGRPKKVKPHEIIMHQDIAQTASILSQKPSIMSIQSLTSDISQCSPHQMQGINQHGALYSTPTPPQRNVYSPMASPMASPSLNCSYSTNTPPSQPHHDKLGLPCNGRKSSKTSADLVPSAHHQHLTQDQNFGESPPPSSPIICAVDFDPPTASTASSSNISENVSSDLSTMHHGLHSSQQRSRFNSPISGEATPDQNSIEHFQQWISPQPNNSIHSPSAPTTMFINSPQQPSLIYHDRQQQMQTIQQQQPQQQELHSQWQFRHQSRYEDLANSPYLLNSQQHPTHSNNHVNNNHQNQHGGSDVARKSLSGLESLVDQIPTISESESIALSSAAIVHAQIAAAAAVESRLQGMQNSSHTDSHVGDDSHYSSLTGTQNIITASHSPVSASTNSSQIQQSNTTSNSLNSNFSVSSLAASSASGNNNINNHDNYTLPSNTRPLANANTYHHPNLMAAAALVAVAANTPTNLSTPAITGTNNHHTPMYMDSHAHLTANVPVNSMYPTVAPPPHHHHSPVAAHHHHHAAAHYGSAQQSSVEYTNSNNPYVVTQSNVTQSHTLHMPSPNYPYGYSTTTSQSNYPAYPHSHHPNHHGHPHAAHHLTMFDRLKPSDITGFSSGF